jgi:putative spermidine/putrescine transport system substrate-binding protein
MKKTMVVFLFLVFLLPSVAHGAEKKEVVVCGWGGAFERVLREAWYDPFEKETGIKVISAASPSISKVKAMVMTKNVEWDIVLIAGGIMMPLLKQGLLEKIDYPGLDPKILGELYPECKNPFGVGTFYFSVIMGYSTEAFPGDSYPKNWAEFWNVKKFPGPRVLQSMAIDGAGWEFALLADGVPMAKIYDNPDMDRAFRKLKEIKPNVVKWWTQAQEAPQLLVDKEAVAVCAYNGRLQDVKEKGARVGYHWNQGKLYLEYMCVPKGAPNFKNALKLMSFQARADRQAEAWKKFAYGPVNKKSFEMLPAERARILPSFPANMQKQFFINDQWYGENAEKAIERWNKWILEK